MTRIFCFAAISFVLAGCCLTNERDHLRLLPEGAVPKTFHEMILRAQKQVGTATEAFYTDNWVDVEDAAIALEQTARFLPKMDKTPTAKADLQKQSDALANEARQLRAAARAKNVGRANAVLQSIHLQIRSIRKDS